MLSTAAVVGITTATIAAFLGVGVIFIVLFLNYRQEKHVRDTTTFARCLNTYHRTHLPVEGSHCSNISPCQASLRRSAHLPHGVLLEGWNSLPSREPVCSPEVILIGEHLENNEIVPVQKRRRSLNEMLYFHSLHIHKTRRQKELDKKKPLHTMTRSPLSAITEFTDLEGDASSAVESAELPPSSAWREGREKKESGRTWAAPPSIQWPLPVAKSKPRDQDVTIVSTVAARDSIMKRKRGIGSTRTCRPLMGQRSISSLSNMSVAPEEPLPPLPSIQNYHISLQREADKRQSNASIATIGSSLLGSTRNSLSGATTNFSSHGPARPTLDLSSPVFRSRRESAPYTTITVGLPAGNQTTYIRSKEGTDSIRASINGHALMRTLRTYNRPVEPTQRPKNGQTTDSSLKTIDASNWNSNLPSRTVSHRSNLSHSLAGPGIRRPNRNTSKSATHSLFKPPLVSGKRASNQMEYSSAADVLNGLPRQSLQARPASVASGNPFQWDLKPLSLDESPLPKKRGHRRQNCVRISNLPSVDTDRRSSSRLPEMTEELEEEGEEDGKQWLETPSGKPVIHGLILLESGAPASRALASLVDVKTSNSPSQSRPPKQPNPRKRHSPKFTSSVGSQGILCPNSDIFTQSESDPITPNLFNATGRPHPRNWPLSPTPRYHIKLNSSPPTPHMISEPYEPDSPILPSPALTSATLFPRASAVKGRKNMLPAGRTSREASPSPLTGRITQKRPGDELRRSVMMLRRMTSEGKLHHSSSRFYWNLGGEKSQSSFSAVAASKTLEACMSSTSLPMRSTSTLDTNPMLADKRQDSPMTLNGIARSKRSMDTALSMMSVETASIWEDASVCRDDHFEDTVVSLPQCSIMYTASQETARQAYEKIAIPKDGYQQMGGVIMDSRLTSPQGKGLGLIFGSEAWGTPGRLYDRCRFLRD